ncbi:VirB4 family type IV secretion system protein [Candidatus Anaplasma sp. TIGMIC]|uniref:VirB4 family type IV secretion system protein n=1 Tax=Candidatus Anaplasma sp. TIGMIC TaxID=3020713 RepID=UPI00232B0C49|nr:hypothetical protein [Candidatus Anaplasma sp. TIGMIC]MDB1135675.1 hypothetical protein [Candidatus Anaplasma sp. TIGMIC]
MSNGLIREAVPVSFVRDIVARLRKKANDDHATPEEEHRGSEKAKSSYAEYVTPACHYSEDTLLNKGGELVQIIQIVDYEKCTAEGTLRDAIRRSIANIGDPDIAFWIYTVRERREFDLEWKNTGDFSDDLHRVYKSSLDEKYKTYANRVYVAVVTKHLAEGLDGLMHSLLFNRVAKRHKSYLTVHAERLSRVTALLLKELEGFSVNKLGLIRCKDGRWRSELLEFLSYLVTFRHRECYLEMCDNAHTISAGCDLSIGFNTLKVVDGDQVKYGTILGVKNFVGESLSAVDECLQQDCEFIVVEVLRFIEGRVLKNVYNRQMTLLDVSGDDELRDVGHLSDIQGIDDHSYGDCCERQVSCTVIADSIEHLRRSVLCMVSAFSTIGALVVRIDLALEDYFWAAMPGNFRYVLRMDAALVKLACTFSVLHEFPSVSTRNGHWSNAITMFFSTKGLPYFFSFRATDSGHTVCLGPQNSSMTLLCNFLLSESRRLGTRAIVFDYSGKSVIYTAAVGGSYHRIDDRPDRSSPTFSPFHLKDTEENRDIATEVLCRMARPALNPPTDEDRKAVRKVVNDIYSRPLKKRTLDMISKCIGVLGGHIRHWTEGGKFSHMISDSVNIKWDAEFLAINAGMLINKLECLSPVLYYLLRELESRLDGSSQVILVLYESWILDTVFYTEAEFDDWVNRLSKLNVVIVFASENIRAISSSRVIRYVSKHADTRIFMPNFMMSSKQHGRMFGITQEEIDTMLQISQSEGHFFLKQGDHSVVLSLKLPRNEVRVLSANRTTIKIMYESVAEVGDDWWDTFHKKCDSAEGTYVSHQLQDESKESYQPT